MVIYYYYYNLFVIYSNIIVIIIWKASFWLYPLEICFLTLTTLKGIVAYFLLLPGVSEICWAGDTVWSVIWDQGWMACPYPACVLKKVDKDLGKRESGGSGFSLATTHHP